MTRDFDIVLYGATGFTGRRAAHYLADHRHRAQFKFAIAGRSRAKLDALHAELSGHEDIGIIEADARDRAALQTLAASTKTVASTAGPFALYGSDLVAACVENKTDYVDITGETPWARSLIDAHHERAAKDGTRIIPFCGFDSIPSELGAALLVDHFRTKFNEGTKRVRGYFKMAGGFNGGTMATMIHAGENKLGRQIFNPILLNPKSENSAQRPRVSPDQRSVERAEEAGGWTAPFAMAAIDTRVVRRSAALSADYGTPYGDNFDYNEGHLFSKRSSAIGLTMGLGVTFALQSNGVGRALLKTVIPKPGEGPSEDKIKNGFMKVTFFGESDGGHSARASIYGSGDPGNHNTVIFMCESALALILDREHLAGDEARGGVLTPATGIGLHLTTRLRDAGLEIEVG